jgi:hypothetical protein
MQSRFPIPGYQWLLFMVAEELESEIYSEHHLVQNWSKRTGAEFQLAQCDRVLVGRPVIRGRVIGGSHLL